MDCSGALTGGRSGVLFGGGERSGSRSVRARGRGRILLAADKPAWSRFRAGNFGEDLGGGGSLVFGPAWC